MTKFKTFLKPLLTRFSFLVKWISYLFIIQKGFKFTILLFRFFSYLLSGSFIAAFMVLYDFSSDITDIWLWINSIKDSFLRVIINTYSKFITNDINLPDINKSHNSLPNNNNNINNEGKSERYKSLRSDNGYKHSVPENDSTPLYKDWRVWLSGAVVITGTFCILYFYTDYLHFGFNQDPKPPLSPGSSMSSNSISINSPFGPTIGPTDPVAPIEKPDLPSSPTSTSSNSTPKASFKNIPIDKNNAFTGFWNDDDAGPSLLTNKERKEFNKYFDLPKK